MFRHSSQRYFGYEQSDQRARAGLKGHWIGGGSGNNWIDRSGYGNDGLFSSSNVTWSCGQDNKRNAIDKTGTSSIDCGASNSLDFTGPMTAMCWIFRRSQGTAGQLVSKGFESGFNATQYQLYFDGADDKIKFGTYNGSQQQVASSTLSQVGIWEHWAGVFTGTQYLIYRNGILDNSANNTTAPIATGRKVIIGAVDTNFGIIQWFEGKIDDVRLYGRALSAAEIYMIGNPPFLPFVQRGLILAPGAAPDSEVFAQPNFFLYF